MIPLFPRLFFISFCTHFSFPLIFKYARVTVSMRKRALKFDSALLSSKRTHTNIERNKKTRKYCSLVQKRVKNSRDLKKKHSRF